jgi:hypothetical protein
MAHAVLGQLDLEDRGTTFTRNDCNNYQSTRRNIPEHFTIRENGCENIRSFKDFTAVLCKLLFLRTVTLYKPGCDPTRILNKTF